MNSFFEFSFFLIVGIGLYGYAINADQLYKPLFSALYVQVSIHLIETLYFILHIRSILVRGWPQINELYSSDTADYYRYIKLIIRLSMIVYMINIFYSQNDIYQANNLLDYVYFIVFEFFFLAQFLLRLQVIRTLEYTSLNPNTAMNSQSRRIKQLLLQLLQAIGIVFNIIVDIFFLASINEEEISDLMRIPIQYTQLIILLVIYLEFMRILFSESNLSYTSKTFWACSVMLMYALPCFILSVKIYFQISENSNTQKTGLIIFFILMDIFSFVFVTIFIAYLLFIHIQNRNSIQQQQNGYNPEAILENLQEKEYSKEENAEFMCPICHIEYKKLDKVVMLPCNHLFHGECVKNWVRIKASCPLCRHNLRRNLRYNIRMNQSHSNDNQMPIQLNDDLSINQELIGIDGLDNLLIQEDQVVREIQEIEASINNYQQIQLQQQQQPLLPVIQNNDEPEVELSLSI